MWVEAQEKKDLNAESLSKLVTVRELEYRSFCLYGTTI